MSTVELRDIALSFGDQSVLRGLNLRIESGQYTVVLGASGCGKTSCLRVIAGLQPTDSGSVYLAEQCVDRLPPRNRDVAMVFQSDGLYPHLPIRKSIAFGLRRHLRGPSLHRRITEAAEIVGISGLLDRYPDQLSGGELRRAAIAKAIARQASVRLMDEPLSALDAPLRSGLQTDLLSWHQQIPGTTIHVTHDGDEAMRVADRIAVMEEGRIIQYATPDEIYTRPATRVVARAIGNPPMNLIPCTDNNSRPTMHECTLSPVEQVEFGIRADVTKVFHGDCPATFSGVSWPGKLVHQTHAGNQYRLTIDLGHCRIQANTPEAVSISPGQACTVAGSINDLHRFEIPSGHRAE